MLNLLPHRIFKLLILLLGILPTTTWSAKYYVNDASLTGDIYTSSIGSNLNTGLDPSSPKSSLTQIWTNYGPSGTNVLGLGDTILVDAGTYYQTDRNLILTVPIVINGAGMQKTTFDNGQDGITGYYFARLAAAAHLMNFKIQRYGIQNTTAHAIEIDAGVIGAAVKYIHIDNCGRDSGMYPIEVKSGANVLFQGGGVTCNNWLQSGGMRIVGATTVVNIVDYLFYNNSRGYDNGSALRIENGTVNVRNTLFEKNRCNNGGVGILTQLAGTLRIYDSKFLDNEYLYSFAEYGGNILVNGGTFYMTRSVVQGTIPVSSSLAYGAGICFDGTTSLNLISGQIDSCYFSGNVGGRGNDLHAQRSNTTVNVRQTTFASASAQVGTRNSSVINLSNSGNPGEYAGGGTVNRINTLAPTYIANPTVADYTGTCGAITMLPVELIGFEAYCDGSETHFGWKTSSEMNNDYFLLTRSKDGINWDEIAKVQGNGTVNYMSEYDFASERLESGYFKISQFDYNGQSQEYAAIYVETCNDLYGISNAFYQATEQVLVINYQVEQTESSVIQLIDQTGRIIYSDNVVLKENEQQLKIKIVTNIVSGIYFLNVSGASNDASIRIAIVK